MLQDRSGGTASSTWQPTRSVHRGGQQAPGARGRRHRVPPDVPQLFADVNSDKVYKLGVNDRDVYDTLQALLGSTYVNQFNRFGRIWKVFLQAEPEFRVKPEDIGVFYVRNKDQQMVPLSTLVRATPSFGPAFTESLQPVSRRRGARESRRRATAPVRRWPPSRPWRRRCCPPT